MRRAAAPLVAILAASACTVGPDYRAPAPAAPAAFAGPQWTGPAPAIDLAHWWTAFRDPELDRLIAIAVAQAPDLQTAASRVRQARYQIVQARAQGLPQIGGSANGQYFRFGRIGDRSDVPALIDRVAGGGNGGGTTFDEADLPSDFHSFSVGFDASWELDLFGRVRRGVEAARAQEQAAVEDARDARVSLLAEIASDYLQMRGFQAQAAIATAEAARQERALSILEHTAQVGLVPQGNAIRQRTALATTRARIAPLQAQALAQIHAIAVLVGEPPETLIPELAIARALPPAPPAVPPGLPVDLVRRRPDVRAAERRLAAATAQIGVSVADLYPRITLTAMPQAAAAWLGSFFLGKTLALSASGAASFPVFDAGRRRAAIAVSQEQREQSYVAWRQAVLGALRDVEDALVRYEGERRANVELAGGVVDARRSLATVEARFKVGLSDLQPVLDGQQQLLQTEDSLAQSDVRLRQDVASLYKALGGGWSAGDPAPARPAIVDAPKGSGA